MGHSYQRLDIVTDGSPFSKCKNEQSLSEERDHAASLKIIYSLEYLQDNTGQPWSLLGRLGARILVSYPKLLGQHFPFYPKAGSASSLPRAPRTLSSWFYEGLWSPQAPVIVEGT